jgi:hypothetical protein
MQPALCVVFRLERRRAVVPSLLVKSAIVSC